MTSTFETLRLDVAGSVARVTLARPDRLNAMSVLMLEELAAAAARLDANPEVAVVVVAGEGRAFCAGFDLAEAALHGAGDAAAVRAAGQAGLRMAGALAGMRAATVAVLHGSVVGGGVVLAASCDLRVAAEGTGFAIPEIDLGIPLGWGGVPRLVAEIGAPRARELVMTGRRFDAAEALRIGLVHRVVPAAELAAAGDELAAELAAKAPAALQIIKQQFAATGPARGLAFADADSLAASLSHAASREALDRYLSGR